MLHVIFKAAAAEESTDNDEQGQLVSQDVQPLPCLAASLPRFLSVSLVFSFLCLSVYPCLSFSPSLCLSVSLSRLVLVILLKAAEEEGSEDVEPNQVGSPEVQPHPYPCMAGGSQL